MKKNKSHGKYLWITGAIILCLLIGIIAVIRVKNASLNKESTTRYKHPPLPAGREASA